MTTTASLDFTQYDSAQLAMMEEMCIVVDFDDAVIGEHALHGRALPRRQADLADHQPRADGDRTMSKGFSPAPCRTALPAGPPHRAFSVFLFDEQWRLLLQKRCSDKILFPLHWANTCCSHPLADGATFLGAPIHGEADGHRGTIRAARRKLHQELGIANEAVPEDAFRFVTKVHYKAPLPGPDPKWGEHEVDYILFCQRPRKVIEATLNLNPNEVVDTRWLTQEECKAFVDGADDPQGPSDNVVTHDEIISPWFGAIARELLHPWWEALKRGDINAVPPDGKIHRLAGGKEAMAGEPVGLVLPHKRESTRDK